MKSTTILIIAIFHYVTILHSAPIPFDLLDPPLLYCSTVSSEKERQKFIQNREIPKLKTSIKNLELKQVQVNFGALVN